MPTIQVPAGQPSTPAVDFLTLPPLPPPAPSRISIAKDAHHAVSNAARERRHAVEARVRTLRAVPDRGANQPPEGVAAETDRDEREQDLAERLVRDRVQRALLVRQLASVTECELEGENPDDSVDEPAGDETRP